MARLCPSLPLSAAITLGERAELALLETLERGLSGAYTLFHSVDWAQSKGGRERRGEIDIVVVNQSGDVLLMEVKSGGVEFRPDGIFKTYSAKSKNVTSQIRQQFEVINSRLRDAGLSIDDVDGVVLVGGAAKAPALREIAHGAFQPALHPGQTLRAFAPRVTWLADQEAAAQL